MQTAQMVESIDVLVVGGGGAALRAAIEANRAGARVALAVKGQLGVIGLRGAGATASGTAADRRGFWPVSGAGDFLESGFEDIIQLGLGMAEPSLARVVAEEAPASRRVLAQLGVHFRGNVAFGTVPTLAVAVRRSDCLLYEDTMITNLLTQDGVCVGAVGVNEKTGEVIAFRSGAVVLGTGGAVQLFRHNVHPSCVTGDGYAMGYRAGAELMNLEFLQLFLGTVYPSVNNLTNWVWGQNPRVYNTQGEEFLERYLPQGASLAEAKAQAVLHNPYSARLALALPRCGSDQGGHGWPRHGTRRGVHGPDGPGRAATGRAGYLAALPRHRVGSAALRSDHLRHVFQRGPACRPTRPDDRARALRRRRVRVRHVWRRPAWWQHDGRLPGLRRARRPTCRTRGHGLTAAGACSGGSGRRAAADRITGIGAGIYPSAAETFAGLEAVQAVEPASGLTETYQEAYWRWVATLETELAMSATA